MRAKSCGTTYKSINVNIIIEIVVTLLAVVAVVGVVAVVLVVVVGIVQSRPHAPGKQACRVAGVQGDICRGYSTESTAMTLANSQAASRDNSSTSSNNSNTAATQMFALRFCDLQLLFVCFGCCCCCFCCFCVCCSNGK